MSALKRDIEEALLAADFEKIGQLAIDDKKVFRILISLTYDKDNTLCWRAIEAVGKASCAVAKQDSETVRTIVQRLLWSLRDESGGIAWSAPEMLGEIVINNPVACADIPPIIVSFHEEESFLKGVLWALGRIVHSGTIRIDRIGGVTDVVLHSLDHADPAVRGLALYAVRGIIGRSDEIVKKVKDMVNDNGRFKIYRNQKLTETSVGEAAREVLEC